MTQKVSPQSLFRAMLGAAAGAILVLTLFVLPAERGIDITGVGTALGLTRMAEPVEAEEGNAGLMVPADVGDVAVQTGQSISKATVLRSDEITLVVEPHSGAEVKARMKKGDHFIFRWMADGGKIKFDMHGEPLHGKENEFVSYWEEKDRLSAQGSFTAPFEGTHGWYWRNRGNEKMTIKVSTTGFYEALYQPE